MTSRYGSLRKTKILFAAVNGLSVAPVIYPAALALVFLVWFVIRVRTFALAVLSISPIAALAVFRVIGLRLGFV